MVRDAQVRLLRKLMNKGTTLETAAAKAGMSERTASTWQRGSLPSETKKEREWKTRKDPFATVWESEVLPLLENDKKGILEAKTILEVLQEKHEQEYPEAQLRTLQRRVRVWRAEYGPPKEVMFPQVHPPGREGAFDFTSMNDLGVTILGVVFPHLMFEFRLSHSRWTWVMLAFSETFEAMLAGIQGALWELRGAPSVLRSDNLSAATHQLREGARGLTKRYRAVVEHYGMTSTRSNPGKGHENGGVEKAHDLLKSALEQALIVRDSTDFDSVEAYMAFVRALVERKRNRGIQAAFEAERTHLLPLPSAALPSYTVFEDVRVSCWSTVSVKGKMYSVPSRLKGHHVTIQQHADVVELVLNRKVLETMPRLRGDRNVRIDYRHVIWSLVKKPGAFARYKYREELFPSLVFRRAYDALRGFSDRADLEYVRVLHLAASTYETTVETALAQLLGTNERFDFASVKALAKPETPAIPDLRLPEPDLATYDQLLVGGAW